MIVIAGAAGDIGTYLSKRFSESGEYVIALDKVKHNFKELSRFEFIEIDLSNENEIDSLWGSLPQQNEVTLINLVGKISTEPLMEVFTNWNPTSFSKLMRSSFDSNYFPIVQATMSFARFAIANNLNAQVINFGSIASEGVFGQVPYGSSKGAIQIFSRVASIELGAFGIRVNCISPGYVESPGLSRRITKERLHEITKASTLQSLVSLNDIFLATKFLHDSKTINGQILEAHSIYGR